MFLLLAIGFVIGGGALVIEWFGGCYKICRRNKRRGSDDSIESNPRTHARQSPSRTKWDLKGRYDNLKKTFEENILNNESFNGTSQDQKDEDEQHLEQIDNMIDAIFEEVVKEDGSSLREEIDTGTSTEAKKEFKEIKEIN